MKKLILVLGLIAVTGVCWAANPSVWRSSFTNTADTTKNVCGNDAGIVTNRRGFFHGVCVSSSAATNGTVTVFNSSASAINPIAVVNTVTGGCSYFDVVASTFAKGLTYSTTGSGNVTLLYDCF